MNTFVLAGRNVRKSYRDYGVYFFTVAVGVALFYVFNGIGSQSEMLMLSESQYVLMQALDTLMSYLSVLISAVLGFLILYANAFLIRRRKKELGLYMLLGMEKGDVSRILICETVLVGFVSLVMGLLAGVLASQGLIVLTARLYGVAMKSYTFVFSSPALWKSVMYFGVAFIVVMLFNAYNINKQALIDLIYADKKASTFIMPHFGNYKKMFMRSIAMLAAAYVPVVIFGTWVFVIPGVQIILIVLVIAGTFFFFNAFSGFVLRALSKKEDFYFRGLNLFTLGQWNAKMNMAHFSISFVCLMLFLSISSISVGCALAGAIKNDYSQSGSEIAAGIMYVAMYIGIVLMISVASILAVAQLSEASDNRARYRMLSKLGASDAMMVNSLFKQILLYFGLPLVLAVMHSIVAVVMMSGLIAMVGEVNILATGMISGATIIALYGGYFMMTFFSAKKMVLAEEAGA
jgi:putative ABC transport system permease protein